MDTPTPVARHPLPKVTMETPLDDSGDYAILSPVINDDDAPTTTGTDDSGFAELEQWRQHMHHPPSLEGTCRALQFIWQLYCNRIVPVVHVFHVYFIERIRYFLGDHIYLKHALDLVFVPLQFDWKAGFQ